LHLVGGSVPSIDVPYHDLSRLDASALEDREAFVAEYGTASLREPTFAELKLDVDTTVTPTFGGQAGACPLPERRYDGRPRYHPHAGAARSAIWEERTRLSARAPAVELGAGPGPNKSRAPVQLFGSKSRAPPASLIDIMHDALTHEEMQQLIDRVARDADVDERTVQRRLLGLRVRGRAGARIDRALEAEFAARTRASIAQTSRSPESER
jgi:hypothetical protein